MSRVTALYRWISLAALAGLIAVSMALPAAPRALAQTDRPLTSVTLAGSLGHTIPGCSDWQQDCAAAHLAEVGNGVWRGAFTIPAGSWEYKLVMNDNWSESYAGNHTNGDGNTTLTSPAPPSSIVILPYSAP